MIIEYFNMEDSQMINTTRPKFGERLLDSFTIRTLSSAVHLMDCFSAAQERRRLNKHQRRLILEYAAHISQVLSYTTGSNKWVTIGLQWCKIPWSALRNAKLVSIMRTSSTSCRNLYTQLQLRGLLMHGGLMQQGHYQSHPMAICTSQPQLITSRSGWKLCPLGK